MEAAAPRNETPSKTVLADSCSSIEIDVPRDRTGTFEPHIVKMRQQRLTDVHEMMSLYARGQPAGETSAHFADINGAKVSTDTLSRITDRDVEEMAAWHTRPLERVHAAVFIDALHVKIRDGRAGPRPIYPTIGVDVAGHRYVRGMWAGEGDGESAKYWLPVLTELKKPRGWPTSSAWPATASKTSRNRSTRRSRHCRPDLRHPPDPRDVPLRRPRRCWMPSRPNGASRSGGYSVVAQRLRANSSHFWTTTPKSER